MKVFAVKTDFKSVAFAIPPVARMVGDPRFERGKTCTLYP
jgi:hypothetical protein